ncbi:MAG: HEAT repeat domain-containing protein [Moorea sp. SIOASIH]|uniref:HEAT repeat domain-containing protein n=1 Tax=Moorena sp. SIOASIH TaxID=2607817 RepID=UPI0013B6693B|nr:HEAT repeat domain-containing protein [Moorena sp. SIOASIH]NEO37485.1 HEAT repeat domain-containing protein [Moorena sp. SIOASIH]
MVTSETEPPAPSETDRLLADVNTQLAEGNVDITNPQQLKQMVESLADSRGMVRLGFVEAFGKIGKPATPFLLEALANHSNPVVRRSCGKALAKIRAPQAVPTLIDALLNDEDTVVKSSSAGALARMGEAAVPKLIEVLESAEYPQSAKGHASWALAFIGSEAAEHLYQAIHSESEDVRMAVVGAIANLVDEPGNDQATEILLLALKDESVNVRAEAATSVSQLDPQVGVPHLIPLLEDPSQEVRRRAILSLGKLKDEAALPPLTAKLSDDREEIRQLVKVAIAKIQKG